MKKNIVLLLLVVIVVLGVFLWIYAVKNSGPPLGDYPPMVYVQDSLYKETSDMTTVLPNDMIFLDTIKKNVPQNESMPQENFVSNVLPIGSKVFWNELDSSIIYIQFSDGTQEKYLKYSIVE